MKKIIVVLLIAMLIFPYIYSSADEEKAKVVVTIYGMNGINKMEKSMNREKAMEMARELNDMHAKEIKEMLNEYGINVTNLFSIVFGFGNGIALYTADIAFFMLVYAMYGNVIVAIILTSVFAFITHLLPIRLFQPLALVGVKNGSITSIGLNGVNQTSQCILIGFVGVIINFVIPTETLPLFIAGYSMVVAVNPFS